MIHACVGAGGVVKIVGVSGTCTSTETASHWAALSRVTALEDSVRVALSRVAALED